METNALAQQVLQKLFVEIEASGRHVHLTCAQAQLLFGHALTPKRPLSQPGQYLANERLSVVGPKGSFENVAVLGPEREQAQVEISLTDARTLGVNAPVRPSGSVNASPGIRIVGPLGQLDLPQGVIVAQRHIHITPQAAAHFGVRDKQLVRLQVYSQRPVVFEDVLIRVSPDFCTYVHLDYDEANACGWKTGDLGRILP